jgi:hypothetical protein
MTQVPRGLAPDLSWSALLGSNLSPSLARIDPAAAPVLPCCLCLRRDMTGSSLSDAFRLRLVRGRGVHW